MIRKVKPTHRIGRRRHAPRPATEAAARAREHAGQAPAPRSEAPPPGREAAIDAAIEMTFPASDPPSWTL